MDGYDALAGTHEISSISAREFFARFKNTLRKVDIKDPGGRYFAILLEQLFYEVSDVLANLLFSHSRLTEFRSARVSTEFYFVPKRRADLVFFDSHDDLIGLVEVKEEDQLGTGPGRQTRDYVHYASSNTKNRKRIDDTIDVHSPQ